MAEFETTDPGLRREMTITTRSPMQTAAPMPRRAGRLPRGLSTADNEVGWRMSLAKRAAVVEAG
ncbi:MAG TPA: hypothetical protein VFC31_12100 [Candidatus Limnocylindria bacterium]|nr:hypothetical protein [Candidatus Limnocylindria bacterium]